MMGLPMTPAALLTAPAVDVIVPCFNGARYLAQALDSVVAQTFGDWRIVLVDDGSTDRTPEIAAGYAARLGARMLHIRQGNRGLAATRNVAIRVSGEAGGAELLALLDADDVWLPERLGRSVAALRAAPAAGLSYGFVTTIDEWDRPIQTYADLLPGREGRIAASIYTRRLHLPCPTVTFRRRHFEAAGGFDETMRATEDRDLWLRIALEAEVVCVPEVLALYRTAAGGMTGDAERMFEAQLRFVHKHRGAPGLTAAHFRSALASVFRQRAETETARGLLGPAAAHLARALGLEPLSGGNWRTVASLAKRALRVTRGR